MSRDLETIKSMGHLLHCKGIDLGDERAVIRTLNIAYRFGEVMDLHERAIEDARIRNANAGEPQ